MALLSSVDAWRFEQRRRDAEAHSLRLVREIPLSLMPPLFRHTQPSSSASVASREDLRKLLFERVGDEYADSAAAPRVAKPDAVHETKRHNVELGRRLARALAQQAQQPLTGKVDKRVDVQEISKRFNRQARPLTPYGKKYQMKNKDEIDELQARLQGYRIDRDAADNRFYDLVATRENHLLCDAVVRELLEEIAFDVYDTAEAATRKKQLPPEQLQFVKEALYEGPESEVLVQKFNVDITRRHLQCLLPLQWLNDEVINFWFEMLSERDTALVKREVLPMRSHFFNSFFFTKVSEGGYNFVNVRRWTRKIDIFAMDKIFVPVNVSNTHWCLAVIFMTEKRIQYFDSMNGPGQRCLEVLLRYLHDEMEHKKQHKFDAEGWKLVPTAPGTPQQENGSDCGVFTCMFADFLSRHEPLVFTQNDMEFHRHRMVLHIVQGGIPLQEDL